LVEDVKAEGPEIKMEIPADEFVTNNSTYYESD